MEAAGSVGPPSIRSTTSGSSTATRASKLPLPRREEGVHNLSLMSEVGIWSRYLGAFDPSACSAGELPRRRRGPTDHWRDFIERQLKQVMEDEREPLGWGQGVEYDEEGEADRVGQQRLLLGMDIPPGADDGIGDVDFEGLLPSDAARAQDVQAHPSDDRREPPAEVLDLVRP